MCWRPTWVRRQMQSEQKRSCERNRQGGMSIRKLLSAGDRMACWIDGNRNQGRISARQSRYLKVSPRSGRSQIHSNADGLREMGKTLYNSRVCCSVRTRDEHNALAQTSLTTSFLWSPRWSSSFVQQSFCHCKFFFHIFTCDVSEWEGVPLQRTVSLNRVSVGLSRTVGHEAWVCVAWDMFRAELFFSFLFVVE